MMLDFSFISDAHFRDSLVNDFREMLAAQETKSWKSVHVLSGSIIEALLTEYLVVSNIKPNGKDPLTLALNDVIAACQSAGVIEKSTASLCDVIREYRNLIHPGRMKRLSQKITEEGCNIAVNLVTLITREVSEKRNATYGPTAEQILKKLLSDRHALAVLPQLISESKEHERVKLVDQVLPDAYAIEDADPFSDVDNLRRLRSAYRQCWDVLSSIEKERITARFAKMVREDSEERIESYGQAFFFASDLAFLKSHDFQIVFRYLFNRLEQVPSFTEGFARMLKGFGVHVPENEIVKFADTIVKTVLKQSSADDVKRTLDFAEREFDSLEENKKVIMEARGDYWVKLGKSRNYPQYLQERLSEVEGKWFNIPF